MPHPQQRTNSAWHIKQLVVFHRPEILSDTTTISIVLLLIKSSTSTASCILSPPVPDRHKKHFPFPSRDIVAWNAPKRLDLDPNQAHWSDLDLNINVSTYDMTTSTVQPILSMKRKGKSSWDAANTNSSFVHEAMAFSLINALAHLGGKLARATMIGFG